MGVGECGGLMSGVWIWGLSKYGSYVSVQQYECEGVYVSGWVVVVY